MASDAHMEKAREIAIAASQDNGEQSSLVKRIAAALSEAYEAGRREGMERAVRIIEDQIDQGVWDLTPDAIRAELAGEYKDYRALSEER